MDLVLVSHDNHADNLDDPGRALALAAPLLLTTRRGASRLGQPAIGLAPCEVIGFLLSGADLPVIYLARAFDDAGQAAQLHLSDHGTWIPLTE